MRRFLLIVFALLDASAFATAQYTLASIDYPGGNLTTARGINNHGAKVGSYRVQPPRHALLIQRGIYQALGPNTLLARQFSEAFKINDKGDVVGYTFGDDGLNHGFLLFRNGTLLLLSYPGASNTEAWGINNFGTVVGTYDYRDNQGNLIANHGFIWNNGVFTTLDVPQAVDTNIYGINDRGEVVGGWDNNPNDPSGSSGSTPGHSFVYSHGQFTSFDVPFPGAVFSHANDISNAGCIVGEYVVSDGSRHGFVCSGATFRPIDFPAATLTSVWGINEAGQIVGGYISPDGAIHGFKGQPANKSKP